MEGFAGIAGLVMEGVAGAAGAVGAVGVVGAWAQAGPEKASMAIRAIDLASFMS